MYQSDIVTELGRNFLSYAAAVNSDRAIPDAKTGLKPVAQRILYTMEDEGTKSSKPHKKCAKTVGSVMGRFHPHGDSSIYEAMVRLSQPWVMRYPLIDWHGNNGNIAGDGAAASRYTESRLSKISEDGLLTNLKKNNVDYKPNYSEDEAEPVTLPSLFPNLLCNPNKGIGVAMACSWLPHNLEEVGGAILNYLKDPELDVTTLIPGPDFPTGGVIINSKEIKDIYKTGRGSVVVRGKYKTETRARKDLIVFYEIPYGVDTESLLTQINEACEKELITGIDEVRDESNKKELRIVVELSKSANEGMVIKKLFEETDLQKSCSFNQVALVDKTPTLLNLKQVFDIYINHNLDVIFREAKYDYNKTFARLEIVNGLLRALEDIDNIINLIKKSKTSVDAKNNLIIKYNFTESQARAIIDMRLGKLASLEKVELETEKAELELELSRLSILIQDETARKNELKNRLSILISRHGDKRRTELTNIEIKGVEKEIVEVIPEECVVIMSQTGDIKKIPSKSFKIQKRNGKGVKSEDEAILDAISTNTIDTLMLFTDKGRMYRLLVDSVPAGTNTSKGVKIQTLISMESDEKVIAITSLYRQTDAKYAVFITRQGLIKKTLISEYTKVKRNCGIWAINLKDGDSIANVTFLKDEDLILITRNGMSIHFETYDIAPIGRMTAGVKSIKLDDDDEVLVGLPIHKNTDNVALFTSAGFSKKVSINEFPVQGRIGKGLLVEKMFTNDKIVGAAMVDDEDNLLCIGSPNSICISSKDIPLLSRNSTGNTIIKNSKLISVVKL